MLKVVTFMKQVATGLQVEGNFGTAHVYRSSLNAIIAYCGKADFTFEDRPTAATAIVRPNCV